MTRKNYRRKLAWWRDDDNHRNHFATGPDCDTWDEIQALVELGLMARGSTYPGGLICFYVTHNGIDASRDSFRPLDKSEKGTP